MWYNHTERDIAAKYVISSNLEPKISSWLQAGATKDPDNGGLSKTRIKLSTAKICSI